MGMGDGAGSGIAVSEINVTPLIDVLLVLLIIFMVIAPVTPRGLDARIPGPPEGRSGSPVAVVVSLELDGGGVVYRINRTVVPGAELEPRLARIFAARQDKTMFVKADAAVEFAKVAEVVDLGRQADAKNIGLMTARGQTGL